ncbi:MAG: TlpA family protein disulfide reductase [Bacteroidetes bacterium]|nr:MAG: TlpA family protein disulfide reductase [Bacteroidota bacterium]
MKNRLLFVLFLLAAGTLFAQQRTYYTRVNYPVDSVYPYNIPLLDMDSTREMNSKDILAVNPKNKKPTVLAFWLTTCRPCHRELATYTANYEEWQKQADFRMVAISIDFPHRFREIATIAQEKQFPFEVYWDRDRLFRSVMPYGGLNGLPQVFIFDKEGKLAYHHKGFRPGDELTLFAKIQELQ